MSNTIALHCEEPMNTAGGDRYGGEYARSYFVTFHTVLNSEQNCVPGHFACNCIKSLVQVRHLNATNRKVYSVGNRVGVNRPHLNVARGVAACQLNVGVA